MVTLIDASVIILAGGRSRRLGSIKALVNLGDKPLIAHVAQKIDGFFREVVVVIGMNDDVERFSEVLPSSFKICRDICPDLGPLGGVVSGLRHVNSRYMAVLPCDSPFIDLKVLDFLYRSCLCYEAAIPLWPNGYIEPLHSFYDSRAVRSAGESALKAGERDLRSMIRRLNAVNYVSVDQLREFDRELLTFFNINSREDLNRAETILKRFVSQ